jgi:hypothetical protein
MNKLFIILFSILCIVCLIGCATTGPETQEQEKPVQEEQPEKTEEQPVEEPQESEETEEPDEEPVPEQKPEEEEVLPEVEEESEEEYQVSEEVYKQTFDDVESLIKELNEIIKRKDYSTWLTYLTREYREKYSNPEVLEELSNQPTLQKYDIELNSLKDYFIYVVAPSRANAKLDDLVFEDENHVKAIMEIKGNRVILYLLEKVSGQWKIAP